MKIFHCQRKVYHFGRSERSFQNTKDKIWGSVSYQCGLTAFIHKCHLLLLDVECMFVRLKPLVISTDRQVYKTIADVEGGRALYDGYSEVTTDGSYDFLRIRETVLLRKVARKLFVQSNTTVSG